MNYLLVSKAQLIEKGIYTDAQELSDGRAVLSINALKVIGTGLKDVEIITQEALNALLLEEKKKTYAEYRRSREEMRELLTAKANVDRLLKMDEEQKKEQEKDHGQR